MSQESVRIVPWLADLVDRVVYGGERAVGPVSALRPIDFAAGRQRRFGIAAHHRDPGASWRVPGSSRRSDDHGNAKPELTSRKNFRPNVQCPAAYRFSAAQHGVDAG
ncbi:hypothetical protein [Streptomyces sp. NBC_00094]|uniref:hypothetical protein n=1 Tax=Streptomyces sp. NBC_00094 TaxID=2903620 RepID=UPI00224F8ED7|nr:hypothetical protein [Streptomyces sp. NBC_00094]MCX5389293.1 hypothetical protein [Streptomyces sp. NBC_00094]